METAAMSLPSLARRALQFVATSLIFAGALTVALTSNSAEAAETAPKWRCGWFENSGPQYATLVDREGEWIVSLPGGHAASGRWPPRFPASQWVRTGNPSYGYGCACMRVTVDPYENNILRIISAYARPLAACRRDPALPERDADYLVDPYDRMERYEQRLEQRYERSQRYDPYQRRDQQDDSLDAFERPRR